ncbi:MAG: hypothetical protein E6Y75_02870 [Anaerococcus sp.]|jgi:uncharacterized coiled-coil protein SlyX|nr:hypothetical protein [Anaerococcus sp.]DAL58127.1 MAG TPA_asm: Cyclic nucleotide-gated cation channel protein [Bacteriophage sp.]
MTSEQRIEALEREVGVLKEQLEDVLKSTNCSVNAVKECILSLERSVATQQVSLTHLSSRITSCS